MVGINHQTLCVGYNYLFPKTWCCIKTPKKTLQWQINVSQEKLRINESHHRLQTKNCVLTLKEICVFIVIFVQDCELIKPSTCQILTLELKSMVSSTFVEALIRMCPQFTRSFNNCWNEISICVIMSPMNLPHLLMSGDELVWTSEFTKN